MTKITPMFQPLGCAMGFHVIPPPRDPNGPVVCFCACCGKAMYCYGMLNSALNIYPSLMLPNFPRVLGPMSSTWTAIEQVPASGRISMSAAAH